MRKVEYLRQRYAAIAKYTGLAWVVVGLIIISPLLGLPFFWEERTLAWGFLVPGLALATIGWSLWRLPVTPGAASLTVNEGTVIVALSWIAAFLFGAVPFMLVGGLNVTPALFESTSGWTTTGLTVVDVMAASHLILLYRSIMQLAGGAGFAIIVLATLTGPTGIGFSSAEGREQQLAPHVRQSAGLVLSIYMGYVIFGLLGLRLLGMGWFDAVNHAFTALSTGGFSTRLESLGYWDSAALEAFVIVLMLLGTTSFLTHYALVRGRWRDVFRTSETRFLFVLIVLLVPVVLFGSLLGLYPLWSKATRVAIFEVVSAASTTGFSTVGYLEWPEVGWLVLIVLMLVGGGAGSTAGGIKQYRVLVLLHALVWEVRRWFLPTTTVTQPRLWLTGRRQFLSDTQIRQAGTFISLYMVTFVAGSGIIAAHGFTLRESLFEFASALGTVGLSVGVTSADLPSLLLWVEIGGMVLGRLEFFALIVGLIKLASEVPTLLNHPETASEPIYQMGSIDTRRFLVLIPVANQTNGQQLGRLGALLAKGYQGEVLALNIIEVPSLLSLVSGRFIVEERRQLADSIVEQGHRYGVPVHTMIRLARRAPDGITKAVVDTHSDLILFGWPETGASSDRLFGSVIDPLIANPPCDIGVVRLRPFARLRTLLVPVTGRANERLAVRMANALARHAPEETTIRLVRVVPPYRGRTEAENGAESAFARIVTEISVPYETRVIFNHSAAAGILAAAQACDMIIIGATREPLFRNLLMGNVAQTVAENARCPVIVVKRRSNVFRSILRETILEPVRRSPKLGADQPKWGGV